MKVLIIEDNEIDRANLQSMLEDFEDVTIVGEACDLEEAVLKTDQLKPDLIFLDVHLGKDLGFEALEKIQHRPQIIITTAHSQYALKGYEIEALDYILKPVMEESLKRAVNRALETVSNKESAAHKTRLSIDDLQSIKRPNSGGFDIIKISDIQLICAERVYSKLHLRDGSSSLQNRTMREWSNMLPENVFLSLDRSTIVNLRELKTIQELNKNERKYELKFHDTQHNLTISATAARTIRNAIE
jgi:two-component system, LytTR family, response regulator